MLAKPKKRRQKPYAKETKLPCKAPADVLKLSVAMRHRRGISEEGKNEELNCLTLQTRVLVEGGFGGKCTFQLELKVAFCMV